MASATLLGNAEGQATTHIDFRSNRPVSEQADGVIHHAMGLLLIDWWENGGDANWYGRVVIGTERMKFDIRHYLRRDMVKKGHGQAFQWLQVVPNGPGWAHPWARLNAREIGRAWHAWNNDPRGAVFQETVQQVDGTPRSVTIDLRPYANTILREWDKRRKREREAEAKEAPGEAESSSQA